MDQMDGAVPTPYVEHSTESLTRCLAQLHGLHNAILRQILAVTAEVERREAYRADGTRTTAAWLRAHLGVSPKTSEAWADVASRLQDLPHLAETFSSGEISFDKLAAAVKLADPESDRRVAEEAKYMSVTMLERSARQKQRIDARDEETARKNRHLCWGWRDGGARLALWGSLTAEQGSSLIAAIDRVAERTKRDGDELLSLSQKRADALVEVAEARIAEDQNPARATVSINVDVDTAGAVLGGETEDGGMFSSDVMERLMCDARVQVILRDHRGEPLGIGRTSRSIPLWLSKQLALRDPECSFPGCHSKKFLQAHHVQWWTRGGPTDLENLERYCPGHHRLFHGGGWHLESDDGGRRVCVRPDGKVLRDGPPPLDYDVKKWLWEDMLATDWGGIHGPAPPLVPI